MAWEDDPRSTRPPIPRPVPDPNKALKYRIKGPAVTPGIYPVGTPQFRYLTASEALRRCSDFWTPLLTVSSWQLGSVLPVTLDAGVDLNAYYDRTELAFFHGNAQNGTTVYSGESPDIVCHEMGHAVLDAHRPQLWDAPFIEVGSFHEFYGDASAILAALQLPGVASGAQSALQANKSSFLSRVAEDLGWAIRSHFPTAVDKDCLRNACNKFKYVDPDTLPNSAPATALSAEVHSFSRVFAGAFYEILSGMLAVSNVTTAARDMGKLLLMAVTAAPIDPSYYAQIAAHMIDADTAAFGGKYRKSLAKVFVDRDILPPSAVQPLVKAKPKAARSAKRFATMATQPAEQTSTQRVVLDAKKFGLTGKIVVPAPVERKPFTMAAASVMHAIAAPQQDIETAASKFVEMLFAHDRVEVAGRRQPAARARMAIAGVRRVARSQKYTDLKTHALVKTKGGQELERRRFLCGCRRVWSS